MLVVFVSVLAITLSGLRCGVQGQNTEHQQSIDDYVACSEQHGIEIPPCNVSSEAQSRIKIYCRHRCHRCSLNSLDLSNFFKPNEQKDLDIFCDYYDYYSYPRLTTVDIVPDFWTVTPSISHLNILQCNMSMLSLLKLVVELKPQSLSLGSLYEPITLFPVIHQTENCISLKEVRDGLRNIAEFKYDAVNRPIDKTMATFLKTIFSNTPFLKSLTLGRCNGSEIIDLIETDMPSVTYLELIGPDITPNVIQCVGNRMKGLENIHIYSIINGSIRKRCSTEETPLSNVTSLSLHYSGVFRAIDSKLDMPNLQTLSISGMNGRNIVDFIKTYMTSVTHLVLDVPDITPDVIQCVSNSMKGLENIYIQSTIHKKAKLNMPNFQTLSISGLNGSDIIDFINTDMPSVTHLELTGPDITPNVIQCVGNRMKGLENIHIYSTINGSIRKRCSTEETPFSNVMNLTLHYSGVFRAIDSKLDMPNLQTLSISGLNGSDIVALFNTDMPFVTSLRLDRGADITPDIIQCIGNRMKGLKDIYISSIIYNSMRKECSVNSTPISNVISLTLHYSEVFQPMDSKLNMPNLQTLSISGLNGSEIVDLIHTDMPSVTCLELTGPDITSDVIQCVGNRMKGLENIHIHSKINGSIRKRCSTEETPLSNVTSLSLHYSGVFQAVHLNFNMPNLITLTISGITSDVTIASTMKGLEHLNIYIIIEQVYLCSNTKDVFRNIKNTSLKMFIFSPPGRLASQPYGCEVIDLSHNGLKDLGRKTFSNAHYFEGVRYLDASFNNISTLYEGCFIGLNNLEELDVSWNHIINISSAHMAELHNLRVLCLAHNELRTLNQGCFEYLTNLEELDVSWNGITHINSSYFAGLHKLQVLILSHNELKTISECLSELIYFSNEMTTLDMSHNFLSSDYSTRCKMTKLQRLYLQNNDYSSITEIVEIIGFDIKYINLSSNPVGILELNHPPINKETLEKISNDFSTSDEVIILRNLRYSWTNSITLKDVMTRPIKANAKITPWLYFQWLLSDKYISQLKHSPIVVDLFNMSGIYTTINATEALLAFPVMNHFSFNLGDQIYCGCEYISTYVMLNVLYKSGELTNPYYKNNWTCKGPWEFAGIPLLQAPQRMFKDCWQGNIYLDNCCVYYKQIYTNKHTIDCSTCGIKNLPLLDMYEFFSKVEVILMSNNQIDDLCETDISRYVNTDDVIDLFHFSQPSKVEVIDFRNNSLESICDAFFKLLNQSWYSSLRKIDLRQNQLITLSKYVLNNRFNLDFIILLAGNRFLCTCDNIWLKDWIVLQPDEMLPDLKSVECRDRKGNLFINMKVSELNCNTSTMSVTSTMWQHVTIGLATTVGILILIAVYLYRVKNKIKVWIYMKFGWHPLDKGDNDNDITDMDYDAFISYSHQDLVWVRENLVDFLQSDNLGYTVCLHERDWPVGVLITENILLSVKHSRRMIMVLSENYLNSEWCRMEFQAAHREMLEGRTKYLIMIAMEGFPLGQLPPEMDFYIKTHTYLEAESNWFKEKLIYAMPETPLTKIRELRSQTNVDMELEVRAISRRRFPALFYRIFIYRDGRGELQQDEEIIVENEEIGEATVDIENDEEETVESEQIDKDVENDP